MEFLNLKVSVAGTGTFNERIEITENWTYWRTQRSEGTSYGEEKGV
jgi:hypothetical protein